MGGERASKVRQRQAGQICCICDRLLPLPHYPGERRCAKCSDGGRRRIYMCFMQRSGWHCQFLEADLKTALPRTVELSDEKKLFEIARRGGCNMNLEGRQAIEHGIETGRGGIWLELTEDQYAKLRNRS